MQPKNHQNVQKTHFLQSIPGVNGLICLATLNFQGPFFIIKCVFALLSGQFEGRLKRGLLLRNQQGIYVPADFSTASVMSTSDSSADVTVIMEGFMSDSVNPVFPTALVN